MQEKPGSTATSSKTARAKTAVFIGLIILVFIGGLIFTRYGELFATPRKPQWAMPIEIPYSKNFFKVSAELYRSAQPTAEAFRAYEKLGIKTVLSLRSPGTDLDLIKGTNLNLVEYPMQAGNISDEIIIEALSLMHKSPKPVLVHCHRGADRAGTFVAAYRIIFEGWDKEAAIDEMINGGYDFNTQIITVPEYLRGMDVEKLRSAIMSPDYPGRV